MEKEGKILNRIVGPKGLSTPGVDEPVDEDDPDLIGHELTRYRSLAARANYLAMDRADLQFAVKELCRQMSRPTASAWRKLIRVGKYLVHRPRLVIDFEWQEVQNMMTTYSDANWAGCIKSRKSTSGGVVMVGQH